MYECPILAGCFIFDRCFPMSSQWNQTSSNKLSHSSLQRYKKLRIFDACICTKLTYGLFTAALNAKENRRLDGFQARCLRRILKIPHAYYSRISNATVLQIARETPLSAKIHRQQCSDFEKLAGRVHGDPTRTCIFEPGGTALRSLGRGRGRGRPRLKWIDKIQKVPEEDDNEFP